MQTRQRLFAAFAFLSMSAGVAAQSVVRDLEALSPATLAQDELKTLLPGATYAEVVEQ